VGCILAPLRGWPGSYVSDSQDWIHVGAHSFSLTWNLTPNPECSNRKSNVGNRKLELELETEFTVGVKN
jgi:hypothetical protein